jgi:predicted ArsR family transcriptional regulator
VDPRQPSPDPAAVRRPVDRSDIPVRGAVDQSDIPAGGPVDRSDILDFVRAADTGLTTAELAAKAGLPISTVRSHLDNLVRAGLLVKARASGGLPFRPAWRYRAAAVDPAPSTYQLLLDAVLDDLAASGDDTRSAAARVGERWGGLLADAHTGDDPTAAVLAVLGALGFTPATPAAASELHLRTCPYLGLVRKHPDAMCGLHAGIIRGVLRQRGAADDAAVLEPFAATGACVVRFSAANG